MIIPVILGGETFYENGIPCVRGGSLSEMDTDDLVCMKSATENKIEKTEATEYWLDGQLVHRSVNMVLKTAVFADGFTAKF